MVRFLIIGPRCSGKTTLAKSLATKVVAPAPSLCDWRDVPDTSSSWIYMAQTGRQVPSTIMSAAEVVFRYIPNSNYDFMVTSSYADGFDRGAIVTATQPI